jgi:hypothetical protein
MHPGAIAGARAALALVAALQGEAEPPRASACPSHEAVWANVAALVGRERVEAARPALTLEDLGDRYRVVVAGRAHDYADPARDCGKRAEIAAVFVGLTLWPLEVAAPPEPPHPPPPPPPRTPVALDLAPWVGVAVAQGQGGPTRAAGARLGVAFLRPRLGFVAGVGAELPVGLDLHGVPVDEQRFPVDLGMRLHGATERVGLAFDLGGVASIVRAAPSGGASTTWLDAGARAAATVELFPGQRSGRPGYFLMIFAQMSPFARSLGLEPDGVVGHASWLRAGAALGVSWKIR